MGSKSKIRQQQIASNPPLPTIFPNLLVAQEVISNWGNMVKMWLRRHITIESNEKDQDSTSVEVTVIEARVSEALYPSKRNLHIVTKSHNSE